MPLPEKLLREISWDTPSYVGRAEAILKSPGMSDEKIALFRKLLTSVRWYELLRILTPVQVAEALDQWVLDTPWPASLKRLYTHAARLLPRSALSASG